MNIFGQPTIIVGVYYAMNDNATHKVKKQIFSALNDVLEKAKAK